jgi:hypothetical protein
MTHYERVTEILDEISEILVSAHADLADELRKTSDIKEIFDILEARDYLYPAYDLITRMSTRCTGSGEYVSIKPGKFKRNIQHPWNDLKVNESFTTDREMYASVIYHNNRNSNKQFKATMKNGISTVTRIK